MRTRRVDFDFGFLFQAKNGLPDLSSLMRISTSNVRTLIKFYYLVVLNIYGMYRLYSRFFIQRAFITVVYKTKIHGIDDTLKLEDPVITTILDYNPGPC